MIIYIIFVWPKYDIKYKQEIRSFSEVLKSVPEKSALCVERLKTFVRSAISDDDKSRNLIIYGLKEENDEKLSEKVTFLFEKLGGIKPRVDACRIRKKSDGKLSRR